MKKSVIPVALSIGIVSQAIPQVVYANEVSTVVEMSGLQETEIKEDYKLIKSEDKNKIVNIPDENLKSAIKASLRENNSDDITIGELESIKSITVWGSSINTLEGIQYCKNLEELTLRETEVNDINLLSHLTKLLYLDLHKNEISDISALPNLKNLQVLNLGENNLTNIDALSNLKKLYELDLSKNNLTNIDILSNLENLIIIDLSNNKINNISTLSNLTDLQILNLSNNNIENIDSLPNLKDVYDLNISNNEVSDIDILSNLNVLEYIDLSNNKINDINVLSNFNEIYILDLSNNQITDLRPLSNISIMNLYLEGQVVDLGTAEIKDNTVSMKIPTIYDRFGGEIKGKVEYFGSNDYKVEGDVVIWKNVAKDSNFGMRIKADVIVIGDETKNYDVTFTQKAVEKTSTNDKPIISDDIMNIINTDIVKPVSGEGSSNSPLALEVRDIKVEDFISFIEDLNSLNSEIVDVKETDEFIIFKLKASGATNSRRIAKSSDCYIELKIDKKLENASKFKEIVESTLNVVEDDKVDIDTNKPGTEKEDKTDVDTDKPGTETEDKTDIDTNKSETENKNDKPNNSNNQNNIETGDAGILGYLGLAGISISSLIRRNRKINKRDIRLFNLISLLFILSK